MSQWHEDLISVESAGTLHGLFRQRVRRSSDNLAYRRLARNGRDFSDYTWADMATEVRRWRAALAAEGLRPGERVAILLRNGPEWVAFDQAALGEGLVTVPLYTEDRAENAAYVLRDAAVRLLLVQDRGRWRRLRPALEGNTMLERVLVLEGDLAAEEMDPRVRRVVDWLPDEAGDRPPVASDPHGLATIVYTSGTTGRPKGVMLSHHNILSTTHGSLTLVEAYREDLFLSFLPLSHTLERTGGYYLPMMAGAAVVYARSVAQLGEDLKRVRPTAIIAVPRVFERIHQRIEGQLAENAKARVLFHWAERVGWARFLYLQGRAPWRPALLAWPLLRRLVADRVQALLGGRLRIVVSGGAPLCEQVARRFIALGVPLLQGYGLTETSPVVAVNTLDDNEPASVGLPIRGTRVRIGADDELLVKGPGVMLGYWNDHAATAEVIDPDGWLHSGDQARIERRHIYITGRLKDILVLSNGEKVPPADMELTIALDPLFEQVMVVGEGRAFLSALLVLSKDLWPGLAAEYGLDPEDPESLRSPALVSAMLARVRSALGEFPGYAKIRRVTLLLEPWTVDNGLVTPTLKLKRREVLARYAQEVEAMYAS